MIRRIPPRPSLNVLGTAPALSGVASLGRFFRSALGRGWHALGGVLFALNALVLARLAIGLVI